VRITHIQIENYKSFQRTDEIILLPGIILIVGKNNAGKSALLHAISLNFSARAHLSKGAHPLAESPRNPIIRVTVEIEFSGAELKPLLLKQARSQMHFAWPASVRGIGPECVAMALENILSETRLRAAAIKTLNKDTQGWTQPNAPGLLGYQTRGTGGTQTGFTVRPAESQATFDLAAGPHEVDVRNDVGLTAVHLLMERIYVFRAERRAADSCPLQWKSELAPDASNLADVLHTLSQNPVAFSEYELLVRQILPDVEGFSIQSTPSPVGYIQVRLWLAPQSTKRLDLTIPLSECGTGVAQILAIIYVVTQSRTPQVISVDEPNSFLHPDASRALIRIVKQFPEHQYIFTTHSSEVITQSGAANLIVLKHTDGQSVVHRYAGDEVRAIREALEATGARLSDVFGYDRVLWVEGPSDARVFEWLLREIDPTVLDLAIRPVRSTGDFDSPSIDQAVDIYRSLSHAEALVPVTIAFLFDREKRPQARIDDAMRRNDAIVRFLGCRMLENCFLDPRVIAA
jgi:predicted ATPase